MLKIVPSFSRKDSWFSNSFISNEIPVKTKVQYATVNDAMKNIIKKLLLFIKGL